MYCPNEDFLDKRIWMPVYLFYFPLPATEEAEAKSVSETESCSSLKQVIFMLCVFFIAHMLLLMLCQWVSYFCFHRNQSNPSSGLRRKTMVSLCLDIWQILECCPNEMLMRRLM